MWACGAGLDATLFNFCTQSLKRSIWSSFRAASRSTIQKTISYSFALLQICLYKSFSFSLESPAQCLFPVIFLSHALSANPDTAFQFLHQQWWNILFWDLFFVFTSHCWFRFSKHSRLLQTTLGITMWSSLCLAPAGNNLRNRNTPPERTTLCE